MFLLRDASSFNRHVLHKKTLLACSILKKHTLIFKFFCRDSCAGKSHMPEPPLWNFSLKLIIFILCISKPFVCWFIRSCFLYGNVFTKKKYVEKCNKKIYIFPFQNVNCSTHLRASEPYVFALQEVNLQHY